MINCEGVLNYTFSEFPLINKTNNIISKPVIGMIIYPLRQLETVIKKLTGF